MRNLEKLTIRVEYDPQSVRAIRLRIQELSLDEELTQINHLEVPKGKYRGILTLQTEAGKILRQDLALNVLPGSENVHIVELFQLPQTVILKPVDTKGDVVPETEIKVETIDSTFRPVREKQGALYMLRPGKYEVTVALPSMELRTFAVEVKEDQGVYALPMVQTVDSRQDPRVQLSIPVGYMTINGQWCSTRSVNLSARGACLLKGSQDPKDGKLFVRLLLDDSTVECLAFVRWMGEKRHDPPKIGVQFRMDQRTQDQLRKWLTMTAAMKDASRNILHH